MTAEGASPPPRPFPEGWFCVAPAAGLPPGAVRTQALSGAELVVFRTEDGVVAAVDPHCPHLGAHLGHGGRVVAGALRCPFHGFRWDADGRCVGTEYPGAPAVRQRLRTRPVREVHGHVLAWWAADARPPDWEPILVDTDGWSDPVGTTLELVGHVQDVAENGVDLGHFAAVHRYFDVSDPLIEDFDKPILHSRFAFSRANPVAAGLPPVRSVFDTRICGLGFSLTDLTIESVGLHCRVYLFATQLAAERMSFTISVSVDRRPAATARGLGRALRSALLTAALTRFLLRKVVADVEQDRAIWEHRLHLARPGLVEGDGPVAAFRRWARQFDPAPSRPQQEARA